MCLAPTFKKFFQNIEKSNVWETIFALRFKKKKKKIILQKVMCRLLFGGDNDKFQN